MVILHFPLLPCSLPDSALTSAVQGDKMKGGLAPCSCWQAGGAGGAAELRAGALLRVWLLQGEGLPLRTGLFGAAF